MYHLYTIFTKEEIIICWKINVLKHRYRFIYTVIIRHIAITEIQRQKDAFICQFCAI